MTTKILVIEDVHYLRNDVMEMLRFEGFDVEGAENGVQGVDVARRYQPDLIICDIMMPELDGYGVLEELRREVRTSTIPFIFLTAKTDRVDMRQGMGMGADDYLTKPFLSSELLETIKARLDRKDTYNQMADEKLTDLRNNITTALPHELRTPLNTIIGFSDMLLIEAPKLKPDQIAEWSQHINLAALRLYRLVENYLTYVRIESLSRDRDHLNNLQTKTTVNPGATVEFQAIHRAQQQHREGDLHMKIEHVEGVVFAEHDLTKIADELLENAFKFSEPGTEVNLKARPEGDQYVIEITNYGRGMSEDQIKTIGAYMQFERFFHEQQGTGLGLVIAKRLTELYGGTLSINSIPDDFTTVTISLQLR